MSGDLDRSTAHRKVAATLAAMSDAELSTVLSQHVANGAAGIGGSKLSIEVADWQVFVKLIPLTDLEQEAGPASTGNLFDLPTWYQYGVGPGSTGFNVWREVATHEIASDWVLDRACSNFPLLYHWRVLPHWGATSITTDIDRVVEFWGNSTAIESRLRALERSTAVVALFLEHIPMVLGDWLADQLARAAAECSDSVALVERELLGAVAHMRSEGLTHFDGHFDNALTDGRHIYLSDFGLATARRFELNSAEQQFVQLTADHDLAYCAARLVNAIVSIRAGLRDPRARNDYVRRCAKSGRASGLGPFAETVVRYAPVASVMNDFYWQLHGAELRTPFPAASATAALKEAGLLEGR
jgi:hypothetical protein